MTYRLQCKFVNMSLVPYGVTLPLWKPACCCQSEIDMRPTWLRQKGAFLSFDLKKQNTVPLFVTAKSDDYMLGSFTLSHVMSLCHSRVQTLSASSE